jgi:hypothetical protein
MILSVPKEMVPGERRVALVPELVPKLTATGLGSSVKISGDPVDIGQLVVTCRVDAEQRLGESSRFSGFLFLQGDVKLQESLLESLERAKEIE